jgi:hypothetical protein
MSEQLCPHCGSPFGPPRLFAARSGPLDGDWLVEGCTSCNAFTLRPRDGGDAMGPLRAALEARGLLAEDDEP